MLEQRAVIKKYSPGTPRLHGADLNKVTKAENKLARLEKTLKRCAHRCVCV
jgi:hypothetical protein